MLVLTLLKCAASLKSISIYPDDLNKWPQYSESATFDALQFALDRKRLGFPKQEGVTKSVELKEKGKIGSEILDSIVPCLSRQNDDRTGGIKGVETSKGGELRGREPLSARLFTETKTPDPFATRKVDDNHRRILNVCTAEMAARCSRLRWPVPPGCSPPQRACCQEGSAAANAAGPYWQRIVGASPYDLRGVKPGSSRYLTFYWYQVADEAEQAYLEMWQGAGEKRRSRRRGFVTSSNSSGGTVPKPIFAGCWQNATLLLPRTAPLFGTPANDKVLDRAAVYCSQIWEAETRYFLRNRPALRRYYELAIWSRFVLAGDRLYNRPDLLSEMDHRRALV